jgi:inhibitor of KinA
MEYTLQELNEYALIIDFGHIISEEQLLHIQTICSYLENEPFPWMVEIVPAFTTITLYYDPIKIVKITEAHSRPYHFVANQVHTLIQKIKLFELGEPRTITIPVCYGGELGPDLEHVATYNNLSVDEVIDIHSKSNYIVYMIGFAPGFPYLGGMSDKIFTPRKSTPRIRIPAGSVGIAGGQTGIYPIDTPGGWQLIGQTPLALFKPNESSPSLLNAGDRIKFIPISYKQFIHWEDDHQ